MSADTLRPSKYFVRQGDAVYVLKTRAYEKLLVSLAQGRPLPLQTLGLLVHVPEDLATLTESTARQRLVDFRAQNGKRSLGRFATRQALVDRVWALSFLSRLSDSAIADDAEVSLRTVTEILKSCEGRPESGPFLEPQKARRFRNR